MKKAIIVFIFFVIFTLLVKFIPVITAVDWAVIMLLQHYLYNLPLWIPELPDCRLYLVMLLLPIFIGSIFFYRRKLYKNMLLLCSFPLVAFLLNCVIKLLVHRPRPPFELQLSLHPYSFGYVSSHSLVTFCLWGLVIYFVKIYCKNKLLKSSIITLSVLWILFVGISRIWLGVHHFSDVVGAYLLGYGLLLVCIELLKKGKTCE